MINKYIALFILSVFISSCAQIILKKSANLERKNIIAEYLNEKVLIGYMLMGISTLGAIIAYRGIALKYGPILESIGYIYIIILSWIFLKEQPTLKKILGIILIIIGIVVSTD